MTGRTVQPAAIGKIIKHERLKRGVKQSALAKRCGLDQGNISRIERCMVSEPTNDTLRKLAQGLRLDDSDFFIKKHRRAVPVSADGEQLDSEILSIGFGFCIWSS